jgi:alanine racemase
MVKANAYGLGAIPVARALAAADPWGFGVATIDEGRELRDAGITLPIVVFTPLLPAWAPAMADAELTPVIGSVGAFDAWASDRHGRRFHIGLDTGMNRAGASVTDPELLLALRDRIANTKGYEGVCTHFHSADTDASSVDKQWRDFQQAVDALGPRPPQVHAANSAAALMGPRYGADLVRPGIYLYGGRAGSAGADPAPVAHVQAAVVSVRTIAAGDSVSYAATWRANNTTRIATVAVGYADGVPLAFATAGQMAIRGQAVPVRGRVTMDMTMIEVPDSVVPGDVATVFGGPLALDEQAERGRTISYQLLTSIGSRVERRYQGAA